MKRTIFPASAGFVCLVLLLLVVSGGQAQATTTADEVRRLRTEAEDLDAAIALAQQYLQNNPELDVERQGVHYELGAAQYAAKDYTAANETLRQLVSDYAGTALDTTADEFVVDDAQFYVGVIEHYFGDRAKGIGGYEKLVNDFPESNRRPQALLLLAGVREQDGDGAKALARFTQLVDEHPQSEQAPEAQLHVGHLLMAEGKHAQATEAFTRVTEDWPDSRHVPTAVLFANRALMAQEIAAAEQADLENDVVVDNEKAILANVELLMEKYGNSDEIAQVMQDLINYYSSPVQFIRDQQTLEKVKPIVAWLRENKPGTRQAVRAVCEYAVMLGRDDIDEALFELDWVANFARESKDESLSFDVQFAKGRVLSQGGRYEEARKVWTALLELAPSDHAADEVRIMLITLDPIQERLKKFDEIARDEQRYRDIRSTAMMLLAADHYREDRFEEAAELADEVIAHYTDTLSVYAARSMRESLESLLKVPIQNRGDYVRR